MVKYFKRFRRRLFLGLFLVGCLSVSACAPKEVKSKVYRIGILDGNNFFSDTTEGLKEGMAELGYVEGRNIGYEIHRSDIDIASYRRVVQKFVDDKMDLIFSFPTEASLETKDVATGSGVPVVFAVVNVEDNNIIDSVRQPGGNITGVRYPGPDLAIKRLEILHEILPKVKEVVVCFQESYPVVPGQLKILRPAAESMGIHLVEVPAESLEELRSGLEALNTAATPVEAVLLIDGPLATDPHSFKIIAEFARNRGILTGGLSQSVDGYETVYGIAIDAFATGKQAALLIDKVLKGTPAGAVPVISSESYLQINYREAKRLGIDIGQGLLIQADKIVQ